MGESKFEREVLDRLMRLETKIDMQDYKGIQEKVDNALTISQSNEERIKKLEDAQKWLLRLIIGTIVGAILELLYKVKM